ncbi:MAG: hypothetical protein P9M07_02080 [Candidatus Aceula meridiana]|nr:hypothetical protein [Candidatus Aceula meridiana]
MGSYLLNLKLALKNFCYSKNIKQKCLTKKVYLNASRFPSVPHLWSLAFDEAWWWGLTPQVATRRDAAALRVDFASAKPRLKNYKGQNLIEYAIVIALVSAAMVAMSTYIFRSVQAVQKQIDGELRN